MTQDMPSCPICGLDDLSITGEEGESGRLVVCNGCKTSGPLDMWSYRSLLVEDPTYETHLRDQIATALLSNPEWMKHYSDIQLGLSPHDSVWAEASRFMDARDNYISSEDDGDGDDDFESWRE